MPHVHIQTGSIIKIVKQKCELNPYGFKLFRRDSGFNLRQWQAAASQSRTH